ncbi:MAG: type II secretion system F family protein [Candidatus Aenigmarchaeota archaeon]|nr:type II secretion system F family protein [Candidatus Aenigmarchaeota archaeon]
MKLGVREKTLILPIGIGALVVAVSMLFVADPGVVGNSLIISLFIAVIPYFLYRYSQYAWLKSIERQFPNFIRDLADSKRSGMTLESAIDLASRTNYGKLSGLIRTMSNKLSWGVPFMRVLEIFEKKVKDSPSIKEVINIIKESYKSGGNVVATLDSAAKNMNMLREAEEQRRSVTNQHVMITYGIFFLFFGIIIMIIYILVPMMGSATMTAGTSDLGGMGFTSFSNPCSTLQIPFPCGLFGLTCSMLDVESDSMACYYVALFFYVLVIQGIFSGLIAGQLGENSVVAGTKHSIIMSSSAVFVFIFLAKLGMFPT